MVSRLIGRPNPICDEFQRLAASVLAMARSASRKQ
jgi:hypothetical protein